MEIPLPEPGHWNRTSVVAKEQNILKKTKSRYVSIPDKVASTTAVHKSKTPKCLIKIAGSRYKSSFLISVDPDVDDAIYETMKNIEAGLDPQPKSKLLPASPKKCLSSVFRCLNQTTKLQGVERNYSQERQKKLKDRNIRIRNKNYDLCRSPEITYPSEAELGVCRTNKCALSEKKVAKMIMPCGAPILNYDKPSVDFSKDPPQKILKPITEDTSRNNDFETQLKPNALAREVSHSIKLENGKVKIGLQDGDIEIDESIQNRSMEMVIRGDGNGKSSWLLTVHDENKETNNKDEQPRNKGSYLMLDGKKENGHEVNLKNNSITKNEDSKETKKREEKVINDTDFSLLRSQEENIRTVDTSNNEMIKEEKRQKAKKKRVKKAERKKFGRNDRKIDNRMTKNEKRDGTNGKDEEVINNSGFSLLGDKKDHDRTIIKENNHANVYASNDEKSCEKELIQKDLTSTADEVSQHTSCPFRHENDFNEKQDGELESNVSHIHSSLLNNSCRCYWHELLMNYCGSQRCNNILKREISKCCRNGSILFGRVPEEDSRMKRMPYLVHKLYETHKNSLFVSEENNVNVRPSVFNGAVFKSIDHDKMSSPVNDRIIKERCLDGSSRFQDETEYSNQNRKFTSTNQQGDPPKKYVDLSNSTVEDFERQLQNICGSNYEYHKSGKPNFAMEESSGEDITLRFDQWTQTENYHGNIKVKSRSKIDLVNILKEKIFTNMNVDHTNLHSISDTSNVVNRTVSSYTQSDISYRNDIGNFVSNKFVVPSVQISGNLDNRKDEFSSKVGFHNDEGFQNKQKLCIDTVCSNSIVRNQLENEVELKESIDCVDAPKLNEEFYLKTSRSGNEEKSSGFPICNSNCAERPKGFYNVPVCSKLEKGAPIRNIDQEIVENDFERLPEALPNNRRFRPFKIKSRSYQNIFVSHPKNLNSGIISIPNPRKTRKQRYPHFTVAEYCDRQAEGLDYEFETNERSWRLGDRRENQKLREYISCTDHKIPLRIPRLLPETRCLNLPQPCNRIPTCNAVDYSSKIRENLAARNILLNRVSPSESVNALSYIWASPKNRKSFSSYARININPSSIFYRTISTIRRACRKKIGKFFRKVTITKSLTRGLNKFTLHNQDKIIFIPVPLEKKYENIHLYKNRNSKNFPF